MTIVCPCVHPSICPKSCPYIFCQINLKFCTLFSYDTKMWRWFIIFVLAIFGGVMVLADSTLVSATLALSFIQQI